ncbi:hypothetical protein [Dactylosporangium sp. NPDC006015]|uniref:hypothetical protein n=1 Tax=Dactylosporangium sp. NPDC006015 TaxID=3154576 RepID=UPI0033A711BA
MRDTVQDEFARFAEEAAGTFRPLPLDALPRRHRHRRLRVWLAAIVVGALTTGGGVALRTAWSDRPPPPPTGFRLVERPVVLAGGTGPHQVVFRDRRHGWVLFRNCDSAGKCAPRLGSTDDGGLTWRPRTLPDLGNGSSQWPLARLAWPGKRTLQLDAYKLSWVSTDGGDTWAMEHRFGRPGWVNSPDPIRVCDDPRGADATCVPGRLQMEGVGDIGVAPVRTGWSLDTVVRTASGALWATLRHNVQFPSPTLLLHSADGTTWKDVRESAEARLLSSPDRTEVWFAVIRTGALALLGNGVAVEQPSVPPLDDTSVVAIGGGRLLLLSGRDGLRLWTAANAPEVIPVPVRSVGDPPLQVLDDGAVAVVDGDGRTTVGTIDGTWIRYP